MPFCNFEINKGSSLADFARFRSCTYARTQQSLPPLWATINGRFCQIVSRGYYLQPCHICRSSLPEIVFKKCLLKNFAKFTGKHLWESLFFTKVANFLIKLQILRKKLHLLDRLIRLAPCPPPPSDSTDIFKKPEK